MSDDPDELKTFLAEMRASGSTESEGAFTIDLKRARLVMERSTLANPNFYLLKLVQAGVAWKCNTALIDFGSDRIQILLKIPSLELSLQSLLEGLQNPATCEVEALHHLCLGLLCGRTGKMTLEWWNSDSGVRLALKGDSAEAVVTDERPSWLDDGRSGVCVLFWQKVLDNAVQEALDILSQRCRFAPCKLQVNGKRLNRRLAPAEGADWHEELTLPYNLIQSYQRGKGLRVALPDLSKARDAKPFQLLTRDVLGGLPPAFAVRCPSSKVMLDCSLAYALATHFRSPATLLFVKHGVTLEPVSLRTGLDGVSAVLDGSDLKVDASQFSLVQGQERAARLVDDLKERVKQDITLLRPHLDRIPFKAPVKFTVAHRIQSVVSGMAEGAQEGGSKGGPAGAFIFGCLYGAWALTGASSRNNRARFVDGVKVRLY